MENEIEISWRSSFRFWIAGLIVSIVAGIFWTWIIPF